MESESVELVICKALCWANGWLGCRVWVAKSGWPSFEPIEDHVVAGQRCTLRSRQVWEQVRPVAKAKRGQGYDEVPRVLGLAHG